MTEYLRQKYLNDVVFQQLVRLMANLVVTGRLSRDDLAGALIVAEEKLKEEGV